MPNHQYLMVLATLFLTYQYDTATADDDAASNIYVVKQKKSLLTSFTNPIGPAVSFYKY